VRASPGTIPAGKSRCSRARRPTQAGFFSTAFGGQRGKGEAPFGGGDDLALMDQFLEMAAKSLRRPAKVAVFMVTEKLSGKGAPKKRRKGAAEVRG